jgi:DNA-binding transcriptional MerR regulator
MSFPASAPVRKYIAKRSVAQRYGVTPRTVDRWKKAKILPPADRVINTREYWDEGGLDKHDRQLIAELAATAK